MIGEMNRKIFLKSYTTTKTAGGGPIKTIANNYNQWAQVEDRSGRQFTGEAQGLYNYDYKITFRAYPTRVITSQFYIEYEGKLNKIEELVKTSEGKVFYWVARCSKVDNGI